MRVLHRRPHKQARSLNYPPTGDALDAIAKGFRALIEQGIKLPAETKKWVEDCERVKLAYPKNS